MKKSAVESVFHGHKAVRLAREIHSLAGKVALFDSLVNLGTASERIGEYDRFKGEFGDALVTFDQAGQISARREDSSSNEFLHNLRDLWYLRLDDLETAEFHISQAAGITNAV